MPGSGDINSAAPMLLPLLVAGDANAIIHILHIIIISYNGGSLNLSKRYSKPCIAKFDTNKLTAIERRPVERTEILHPCKVCALEGEIMGLHSLPLPRSRRNYAKKAKDLQHIPRPNLAKAEKAPFQKHVKRQQTMHS